MATSQVAAVVWDMKREWPDNRRMALAPFVRAGAEDQLNLERSSSATGQQSSRRRTIFVIKKTSRLASTTAAGMKIQRILIFDDHPDSLRLVFGRRLHPYVDFWRPQRVMSWELIVVSIVTLVGLIGMVWPLV
jgi:hypothetical protein